MGDFVIFPKEYFEIGKLFGNHYAIHLCAGEWRIKDDNSKTLKGRIKRTIKKCPWLFEKVQIIVRKRRYKKLNKGVPFYGYYLAQKQNRTPPEL